jgi:hypothetical protein
MNAPKERIDIFNPADLGIIQRFVVENSFENLRGDYMSVPVTLSDGAIVFSEIYDRKNKIDLRKTSEERVDVESLNPVPTRDEINPFIIELLFRKRKSFIVKTGLKDDWVSVRFKLEEPPSKFSKSQKIKDYMLNTRNILLGL